MKAAELKKLTLDELKARLVEQQEEQMRRRCNHTIGQLPDVQMIRKGRREIARIMTVINQKQSA